MIQYWILLIQAEVEYNYEIFFVLHVWSYNIWIHIWDVFVIKLETLVEYEQESFVSFIMFFNVLVRCCYFSLSTLAIKNFLYMIFKNSITSCFDTTKWMTINRTWDIDTNRRGDRCHIFITFLSVSWVWVVIKASISA